MLVILSPSLDLRIMRISDEETIIYILEESFKRFSGLSNVEVVIFITENNDTSEVIINDEFLQMEQK